MAGKEKLTLPQVVRLQSYEDRSNPKTFVP